MKFLEQEVRALLHAAQRERKEELDRGRMDTVFQVGDQVLLRTKELLDAAEVGKLQVQPYGQPGPAQALPFSAGSSPPAKPCHRPRAGG